MRPVQPRRPPSTFVTKSVQCHARKCRLRNRRHVCVGWLVARKARARISAARSAKAPRLGTKAVKVISSSRGMKNETADRLKHL